MDLRKTAIRVDYDAVREAAEILGTSTLTDTVNAAMRELVDQRKRLVLLEHLATGEFDFDLVDEAWH